MSGFNSAKDKIKSRGYWIVDIHPEELSESLNIKRTELIDKMRENSISLRGWDYPHIPTQNDEKQEIYLTGNKVESWIDWDVFKEIWRFYENRQFVHLFGIVNDWYDEMDGWGDTSQYKAIKPNTELDFVEVIYRLTEIFQFVKNLYSNDIYASNVAISIVLHNLAERYLSTTDRRRFFNSKYYKCRSKSISIERRMTKDEILEKGNSIALDIAEEIFQEFQWTFPKEAFKSEQEKFINRQLF